jgi:hypothetical protein
VVCIQLGRQTPTHEVGERVSAGAGSVSQSPLRRDGRVARARLLSWLAGLTPSTHDALSGHSSAPAQDTTIVSAVGLRAKCCQAIVGNMHARGHFRLDCTVENLERGIGLSLSEGPRPEGVNGSQLKFLTEFGLCPKINPNPLASTPIRTA